MISPRRRRQGLLASLYFSQGLPFGFFMMALPVLLRENGTSLSWIGLTSLLALPWALKFLWAPFVDRFGSATFGRRRSWIVPLQLLSVVLLLTAAAMPPTRGLPLLLAVVLLTNVLSATQDVASDGLAVDMLPRSERGLANGIQVAGYRLGMIVGGGLILMLHPLLGWAGSMFALAAGMTVASVPILLHREQPAAVSRHPRSRGSALEFLRRPGNGSILLLLLVYKLGDAFATGMLRPMMVDLGYSLADVGWILGTAGFIAGLLGALTGRRAALTGFAALQAVAVGGYLLPALGWDDRTLVLALVALEHLAGGMATAALFTCMMDWCEPGSAATDYTVQASAVVIATSVASTLAGVSAQALGYPIHFALAALLAAASVLVVRRLFPPSRLCPAPVRLEVSSCG